jgi:LPS-assembly protein
MPTTKLIRGMCVVLIVSFGWSNHPLFAQTPQDDKVKVYAEHLIRVSENVLKGYGYVDVYYGDVRLRGDSVILNSETGEIDAQGHVILDDKGNRLVSERLLFNFKTKLGKAYNGFGFI